jgi:hypothetical protein
MMDMELVGRAKRGFGMPIGAGKEIARMDTSVAGCRMLCSVCVEKRFITSRMSRLSSLASSPLAWWCEVRATLETLGINSSVGALSVLARNTLSSDWSANAKPGSRAGGFGLVWFDLHESSRTWRCSRDGSLPASRNPDETK